MIIDEDDLEHLSFVIRHLHSGEWTWEQNHDGSWDLYANRGAPIDPDRPLTLSNRQHGAKILRNAPDTFDSTGEDMREFMILAHKYIPSMINEIRVWRGAFRKMANVAEGELCLRLETRESYQERKAKALDNLMRMAEEHTTPDPDYVDLEDDAIKE